MVAYHLCMKMNVFSNIIPLSSFFLWCLLDESWWIASYYSYCVLISFDTTTRLLAFCPSSAHWLLPIRKKYFSMSLSFRIDHFHHHRQLQPHHCISYYILKQVNINHQHKKTSIEDCSFSRTHRLLLLYMSQWNCYIF